MSADKESLDYLGEPIAVETWTKAVTIPNSLNAERLIEKGWKLWALPVYIFKRQEKDLSQKPTLYSWALVSPLGKVKLICDRVAWLMQKRGVYDFPPNKRVEKLEDLQ